MKKKLIASAVLIISILACNLPDNSSLTKSNKINTISDSASLSIQKDKNFFTNRDNKKAFNILNHNDLKCLESGLTTPEGDCTCEDPTEPLPDTTQPLPPENMTELNNEVEISYPPATNAVESLNESKLKQQESQKYFNEFSAKAAEAREAAINAQNQPSSSAFSTQSIKNSNKDNSKDKDDEHDHDCKKDNFLDCKFKSNQEKIAFLNALIKKLDAKIAKIQLDINSEIQKQKDLFTQIDSYENSISSMGKRIREKARALNGSLYPRVNVYNTSDHNKRMELFQLFFNSSKLDFDVFVNSKNTYQMSKAASIIGREFYIYDDFVYLYIRGQLNNADKNTYNLIELVKGYSKQIKKHIEQYKKENAKLIKYLNELKAQINSQGFRVQAESPAVAAYNSATNSQPCPNPSPSPSSSSSSSPSPSGSPSGSPDPSSSPSTEPSPSPSLSECEQSSLLPDSSEISALEEDTENISNELNNDLNEFTNLSNDINNLQNEINTAPNDNFSVKSTKESKNLEIKSKLKKKKEDFNSTKTRINNNLNSIKQKKEIIRQKINQVFGKELSKNKNFQNLSLDEYKIKIKELEEFLYYSLWRNSYDVVASYSIIVDQVNLYTQLWEDYSNNKFNLKKNYYSDKEECNLEEIQTPQKLLKYLSTQVEISLKKIKLTNRELKEDVLIATQNIHEFKVIQTKIDTLFTLIPPNILKEMIEYSKSNKSFSVKMAGQQLDPDGPTDGMNVHGGNAGSLNPRAVAEAVDNLIEKASAKIKNSLDDLWGNGVPKTVQGKNLSNNVGDLNNIKTNSNTAQKINEKNLTDSTKRTLHGEQRHGERPGIEEQKVIREGDQYVQPNGEKVYVRGNEVVITGDKGTLVSKWGDQKKSETLSKIKSGRWKPVDKNSGQTKQGRLDDIFNTIKTQRDCRSQ